MDKNIIITVTQPNLPPLDEFIPYLEKIWENKWLTNNGPFHQQFEEALAKYLGVSYISVFSNGTLALLTAMQALEIKGEVITTPYSFVATSHSLWWNNITPVFVDIEPDTCNINPDKIEKAITNKTTAILPVHVYGNPCNDSIIKKIAESNNLKVIYDAAHAFGVKYKGSSILNLGDLSVLSFHATKVFNTFEGGAIVSHTAEMKQHIDDLKNFGFRDEVTVVAPGINAKMNEFQAAFGLLQLKYVGEAISKRKELAKLYSHHLKNIKGIRFFVSKPEVQYNYGYFPIFINENEYGKSRDYIYELLKKKGVYARRYFYPLISEFPMYTHLPSSNRKNLTTAYNISREVLCLPIYPNLEPKEVISITNIIKNK